MSIAYRELLRRPGRFAVAGGSLALLTVLLLLLGGLLDGLFLGSTGAIRAQDASVFVYSSDARDAVLRSRIDPELRGTVQQVDGVADTAGLGVALVAARPGDAPVDAPADALLDVAVIGYEAETDVIPAPPPPGQAWADGSLRADGVAEGDRLLVGPAEVPVTVAGFVEDTSYLLQGSLWVDASTWREVLATSRPDAAVSDGVFQVLLVNGSGDPGTLASRIDAETAGATSTLTQDEAVLSLPGTQEQNSTFTALIGVTFVVAGLITALFFALLSVERTPLFATVKALGVPTWRLARWSVTQAVLVAVVAYAIGLAVTIPLAAIIPDGIPLRLEPSRALVSLAVLVVTAALGSAFTLRRIARIDPASAIS